jgi:hypothetical protein
MMNKQAGLVRNMMSTGMPDSDIEAFRREMFPKTLITLAWSTLFTGSILDIIVSGAYALL